MKKNKQDNFFIKLKNNIYNIKTFSEYVKDGIGKAILYAFILSLIIGGIQGISMGFRAKNSIEKNISEFNNPKYDFTIKDGVLNMKNSPIKINENNGVFYLDSKNDLKDAESLKDIYVHENMYVLFLKDGIKIGQGANLNKQVSYNDLFSGTIDNKTVINDMKYLAIIIVPVLIIVTIIQYFISFLLNCLLVTAFSIIIGMIMGLRIKSKALYSLSIYAATLPSILLLPFSIIRPSVYFDNAFIAGATIYVIFILRYIKKDLLDNIKRI